MTAATQLALIYATESKILRRKVIPDYDAQLDDLLVAQGESLFLMPLDRPYDDPSCQAAVAAATGVTPPSGRCCVIDDTGNVIGVCNADPTLDTHPQGSLVASDTASHGDRYIAGVFVPRHETAASTDSFVPAETAFGLSLTRY